MNIVFADCDTPLDVLLFPMPSHIYHCFICLTPSVPIYCNRQGEGILSAAKQDLVLRKNARQVLN